MVRLLAGLPHSAAGNGLAPTMPSGYTYKCRMGAMRVDGAGNLLRTLQKGALAQYTLVSPSNTQAYPSVGTTASATFAAMATGPVVPPTASTIKVISANATVNAQDAISPNAVPFTYRFSRWRCTNVRHHSWSRRIARRADLRFHCLKAPIYSWLQIWERQLSMRLAGGIKSMRIKNLVAVAVTSLILTAPAVLAQFSKSTVSSQINSQFPDQNTGQITPATTRAFLNNMLNSYQQYAGLNKQAGATYTIQSIPIMVNLLLSTIAAMLPLLSVRPMKPDLPHSISMPRIYQPAMSSSLRQAQHDLRCIIILHWPIPRAAWIISDGTNYQCMFGLAGTALTTPLTVAQGGTGVTNSNFTGLIMSAD